MPDESVKVAVRVRPFNQREKDRKAKLIINMKGQQTTIRNPDQPNEEPKRFTFDYSYWSHDGFDTNKDGIMEAKGGSHYAGQRNVFNDLGKGVLNNAFEGYNCSLFAYGQTGSGKSYSMVGYGPNKGIVPITCDELFKTIQSNKGSEKRYEVTFSMLEIYNEQVRDLLSKDNPKGGLQVRQNPKLGLFYVQDLKAIPVGSYQEIEKRMEQGTASRTVASTNMNATSSRAHTVVTITFIQVIKTGSGETQKKSVMNLVDLAGSERADSTGATGDRLKEGANINKSLSALGNVISALADLSTGKKKVIVPYRDSVLTKLLANALGGNSKTIMIAALSPADINYDETLGTLRYADRAKRIKNKAVINENPMEKMIRELKLENDRLKKLMEGGGVPSEIQQGMTTEDIDNMRRELEEEIRSQLAANQDMLAATEGTSWEERLREAREETQGMPGSDSGRRKKEPHLVNLNEDPMLSGVVFHHLGMAGETTIGRKDASKLPTICLSGLSIMKEHAIIRVDKGDVEIRPAVQGAKTKVNGQPLTGARVLAHQDRILFGSNHLYVYHNPLKAEKQPDVPEEVTWEFAQKEIAQAKGFATASGGLTKDQQVAQEQVLEILPMVSEANAISEELNKHRTFEVVLISAAAQEDNYGSQKGTKVMVKMKNLLNGNTWLWERGKFMNRRYLMQDMYQRWLDGDEDVSSISKEQDPFWEPAEDVLIGTCNVFLQSLAYALDFDDRLAITDYKGQEEGFLYVNVTPCMANGKPMDEDYFVDNPADLLGRPFYFKVTVRSAEVNKARFSKGIQVKYRCYKDKTHTETQMMKGSLSPEFNHTKVFSFPSVDQELLDFFESGCVTFLVHGVQEDQTADPRLARMTTKELRQMENITKPGLERQQTTFALDSSANSQLKSELLLLQRKFERLECKEKRMQELCKEWGEKPDGQKKFDPFYRSVSAVANSSGTRLRTKVQVLNKQSRVRPKTGTRRRPSADDDTISLFVFGEDESFLEKEAQANNGYLDYQHVRKHYGERRMSVIDILSMQKAIAERNGITESDRPGSPSGSAKGSKACVVQ